MQLHKVLLYNVQQLKTIAGQLHMERLHGYSAFPYDLRFAKFLPLSMIMTQIEVYNLISTENDIFNSTFIFII